MTTMETSPALPVPVQTRGKLVTKYARTNAPIVPPGSVAGRSLTFVIAIMGFLASITAGGVYIIFQAANTWTNNISSEITVQIQQRATDNSEAKVSEIVKFLSDQNGVKRVTPFSREQSLKLVEPWIGKSEVLKSFAIPRLVAVEIERDSPPDLPTLKKVLEAKYPGSILDDHGLWRREIRHLTRVLELSGLAMLLLITAATAAVIVAAATSALASNREIVEVLNFVGAEEKFIAKQFESHFLKVGIRAGIFGASLAALGFLSVPYIAEWMGNTATSAAEIRRFVGAGTLDVGGYVILLMVVVAIATICKLTSRYGVRRILNQHNS
jgi:cell division transport system permease protein